MPTIDEAATALSLAGFTLGKDEVHLATDWQRRPIASVAKCLEDIRSGIDVNVLVAKYVRRAEMYADADRLK
jgi:hypothetical protein